MEWKWGRAPILHHNPAAMNAKPNRLAASLPPELVCVGVETSSKKRAFELAALQIEAQRRLDHRTVMDQLFERERLGSTGLGYGVAIPHARMPGLTEPLACVIRLDKAVEFDAPDDEPVDILVFLLVPKTAHQQHLETLAEIAEMLSDAGQRQRLREAATAAELHARITAWSPATR